MSYEGLLVALNEPIPDTEVLDDEDAEHEAHSPDAWTIVNRGVDNHSTGIQANDEQAAPRWNQTLESASTGITGRTEEEYKRLIRAYEKWLRDNNFIEAQDDVFAEDISPDTPNYIAMFIMDTCDEITLSGSPRPPQVYRGTHAHGMKIRSALTYGYGRLPSRGRLPWHQTDQDYNHQPHIWSIDGAVTLTGDKEENGAIWGGGRTRRLLECAYTLAFWCLLRFDEVMQIKTQHLVVVSETCIQLTLPFRKTHQCGGIKPFYLHRMPIEDAFMCPVRALARWIELTKAPPGYLFPPVRRGDKIGSSENHIVRTYAVS
ncbi:hypothetical protein C8Q78DRAFT_1082069 [Trametes maxima]|nr:hypothetical protein C8Q78DRAFT_1082069 [Trametes maxima]